MGSAPFVQVGLGHERSHRVRLCRAHHPARRRRLRRRVQRRRRSASLRDAHHDVLGASHLQLHLAVPHRSVERLDDVETFSGEFRQRQDDRSAVALFLGRLGYPAGHGGSPRCR